MSYLGRAFAATLAMGYCAQHPSSVNHGGNLLSIELLVQSLPLDLKTVGS